MSIQLQATSPVEAEAQLTILSMSAAAPQKKRVGLLKLSKENHQICLKVELAILIVVIGIIWALLAIPIFFFASSSVCLISYTRSS